MEGEKRIPLEIFDELAGVKEVSLPVKNEDDVTLAPKLTKINHSYLKETSRSFFSKVAKDFTDGIYEYFLFIQALQKKDVKRPPSVLRTTINFFKKVKEVWDFISTLNTILDIASFLGDKLSAAKSSTSQDVGRGIHRFIKPLLNIRDKVSRFFTFKKVEVSTDAKPVIKDKKPSFSFGSLSPFKSKKSLILGIGGTIGSSLVVHKVVTEIRDGGKVTIEKAVAIEEALETDTAFSPPEKLSASKNLYFSLLSKQYEALGDKGMTYLLSVPNYEFNEPVTIDELLLASTWDSQQYPLRKADVSMPWLRLWNSFLTIVKEGFIDRTDIARYQSTVSSFIPEQEKIVEMQKKEETSSVVERGYKALTPDDFANASSHKEVIAIAERGKFNLMDEGKRLIASKEKEIAAHTRKYNNWVGILGLLSLKLNNQ